MTGFAWNDALAPSLAMAEAAHKLHLTFLHAPG
jgi:hypothetical protein